MFSMFALIPDRTAPYHPEYCLERRNLNSSVVDPKLTLEIEVLLYLSFSLMIENSRNLVQ